MDIGYNVEVALAWQSSQLCGVSRDLCCLSSSLASQPPKELERILSAAKQAGVTIVSLPLVNQWTQVAHLSSDTFHSNYCKLGPSLACVIPNCPMSVAIIYL